MEKAGPSFKEKAQPNIYAHARTEVILTKQIASDNPFRANIPKLGKLTVPERAGAPEWDHAKIAAMRPALDWPAKCVHGLTRDGST